MKRGTPQHPKTLFLMAILELPRYAALGILEGLWHFTAAYAPSGDVGRFTDQQIACSEYIGWGGNAASLISALVQAGWLDRCHCHRVRVHDWPQHADQTVTRALRARKQAFASCYQDERSSYPAVAVAVAVAKPEPLPEPCAGAHTSQPTVPPLGALPFDHDRRPGTANPLVDPVKRQALTSEWHALVREEAAATGEDPETVAKRASSWTGPDGRSTHKLRPDAMTDDRLLNTVMALRKAKAEREARARAPDRPTVLSPEEAAARKRVDLEARRRETEQGAALMRQAMGGTDGRSRGGEGQAGGGEGPGGPGRTGPPGDPGPGSGSDPPGQTDQAGAVHA